MAVQNSFLVSEELLKQLTPLAGELDFDYIYPHLLVAQDKWIQTVLGTQLYDKLMADIADSTVGADEEILLDDYIAKPLVHWAMYEALEFLAVKIVNSGVVQRVVDDGTPVSIQDARSLAARSRGTAEFYTQRLIGYLCANNALFPEYTQVEAGDVRPSNANFSGGLNLGENGEVSLFSSGGTPSPSGDASYQNPNNVTESFGAIRAGLPFFEDEKTFAEIMEAMYFSPLETIDRTINVDITGDDNTGDGTELAPFATIERALESIGRIYNCTVTIQLGGGSFAWNEYTKIALEERVVYNGQIQFKGKFSTVHSACNFVEITEKMVYQVTKTGLTLDWDELVGLFVLWHTGNERLAPISWNTDGTNVFQIEMARWERDGTWDIVQLDTIIELDGDTALDISIRDDAGGVVFFRHCDVRQADGQKTTFNTRTTNLYFQDCRLYTGNGMVLGDTEFTIAKAVNLDRVYLSYAGGSTLRVLSVENFIGLIDFQRVVIDDRNGGTTRGSVIFNSNRTLMSLQECCFRGSGSNRAFDGHNYAITTAHVNNFRDYSAVINLHGESPKQLFANMFNEIIPFIQTFNVTWFFENRSIAGDVIEPEILLNTTIQQKIVDDGNMQKYFRTSADQFLRSDLNYYFKPTDTPIGQYSEVCSAGSTTDIFIGELTAIYSWAIDYVIIRGSDRQNGTLFILNINDIQATVQRDIKVDTGVTGVTFSASAQNTRLDLEVSVDAGTDITFIGEQRLIIK